MNYDRNGNYDYEAAAMGRQLRAHGVWMRARDGIGAAVSATAAVALGLLIVALVIAASVGGEYLRWRAVGAGVRDALEDR